MSKNRTEAYGVICSGRVDKFLAWPFVKVIRYTWFRWTRYSPQVLTRACLVGFLAAVLASSFEGHAFGPHPDWTTVFIVIPVVMCLAYSIEKASRHCERLNHQPLYISDINYALSWSRLRPAISGLYQLSLVICLAYPSVYNGTVILENLSAIFALTSLTMIRPDPPAKKERQWFRLPHLSPIGAS